jgi:predicted nucleic acid-binding protein
MLIDSSVWLEIFLDGRLNEVCRKAITQGGDTIIVSTLTYFEVYRKLCQKFTESKALEAIGALSAYQQIGIDQEVALTGADLSIEHQLGMADSLLLAQARQLKAPLITLDNDFAGIEGVRVLR